MILRQYRFKFFLNARHDLEIDGKRSCHPHTWELTFFLIKENEEFVQFTYLEEIIGNHLQQYEAKTLNDVEPFNELPPTLEIIGEVFFKQISELLSEDNWKLSSLEISENSSRSYYIKDTTYTFKGFSPVKAVKESKINSSNYLRNTVKSSKSTISVTNSLKTDIDKTEQLNINVEEKAEVELLKEQIALLQEQFKAVSEKQDVTSKENDDIESAEEIVEQKATSEDKHQVLQETIKNQKKNRKYFRKYQWYFVIALLAIAFVAIFLWITRKGYNPWGSDTWGHIFKTHFLYGEVIKGNIFPQFTKLWYNGIQPFRYWAPFPYYVMVIGELISGGNVLFGYYFFVAVVFFLGALPWVIYGKRTNSIYLGTILGIIYFILPDNYRLLLAEGNLPRVVVSVLFPYMLLGIFSYLEKRRNRTLVFIYIMMMAITLTHAMIAALVGITIFLYLFIRVLVKRDKFIESVYILGSAVFGIISSAMWLYPALKGGIVSLSSSGNSSVMESLTYKITQSLNPYFRFAESRTDAYYFGAAIFIVIIIGLLISKGKTKSSFIVVFIIFLGTTKWFLFALKKLPMSELFWMMRFTPMAMAFFLFGLMDWKELKKKVLYLFIGALILDSLITMNVVNTSLPIPRDKESVAYATSIATQRVAMMDLSTYDSDPSFHISYGTKNSEVSQVFGWAWQGASTATNIVKINDAFIKGYYKFMFDSLLELGADTVIVKKVYIEDETRLLETANELGYKLKKEFKDDLIFKYDVNYEFATKVTYPYLAIGKFANNVSLAFPKFKVDKEMYIDKYDMDYLKAYKKIVLTGFKYYDKKRAEEMIQELAKSGVQLYIDLSGQEGDMYSMRAEFLNVIAEPLNLKGNYPTLIMAKDKYILGNFMNDSYEWNTFSLANMDEDFGVADIDNQQFSFYGNKFHKNINFVGFNLFYYLYEQRNESGLELMGNILEIEPETLPEREVVEVRFKANKSNIQINASPGTLMPMAKLDAFKSEQSIDEVNNLSLLVEGNTNIDIVYPYVKEGWIIASSGMILFIFCLLIKDKIESYLYNIYMKVIRGTYEKNN